MERGDGACDGRIGRAQSGLLGERDQIPHLPSHHQGGGQAPLRPERVVQGGGGALPPGQLVQLRAPRAGRANPRHPVLQLHPLPPTHQHGVGVGFHGHFGCGGGGCAETPHGGTSPARGRARQVLHVQEVPRPRRPRGRAVGCVHASRRNHQPGDHGDLHQPLEGLSGVRARGSDLRARALDRHLPNPPVRRPLPQVLWLGSV
mmetsp:Transcript_12378/g.25142  ORF Transcript_12378/g.25142 Transcript_12378/m.25142 type:complete len:203 (+) Transcript_12378:434-1042(+)